MNVIDAPEQMMLSASFETILTDGVTDGFTVIACVLAVDVPHAFCAVTDTLPAVDPIVTVMLFVPVPAVIVAPAGTVQLYVVAPGTAVTEYVKPVVPAHTVVVPVIAPGVAGVLFTVIVNVFEVPVAGEAQAAFEVITT